MDDGDFAWWSITLLQSTFMPTSVNLIQCLYQCSIVNCPPPIARKWPRDTLQYFKLSWGHFRAGDSLKYYTDNSWELSSGDTAPIPRTDSYLYRLSLIFQLCSPFFISENTVVLFLYHHVFCSEINTGSKYSCLHDHRNIADSKNETSLLHCWYPTLKISGGMFTRAMAWGFLTNGIEEWRGEYLLN